MGCDVNLLLYGAPGSGKGTQANMLRSRYGIPHIAARHRAWTAGAAHPRDGRLRP
ncbi:MAG: hypothetical protein E6J18_00645 [Chloroflexi bacterium]|nr:MAG: hypothetical protein E6J18_00645 [Chloroflexota bacterium]